MMWRTRRTERDECMACMMLRCQCATTWMLLSKTCSVFCVCREDVVFIKDGDVWATFLNQPIISIPHRPMSNVAKPTIKAQYNYGWNLFVLQLGAVSSGIETVCTLYNCKWWGNINISVFFHSSTCQLVLPSCHLVSLSTHFVLFNRTTHILFYYEHV